MQDKTYKILYKKRECTSQQNGKMGKNIPKTKVAILIQYFTSQLFIFATSSLHQLYSLWRKSTKEIRNCARIINNSAAHSSIYIIKFLERYLLERVVYSYYAEVEESQFKKSNRFS